MADHRILVLVELIAATAAEAQQPENAIRLDWVSRKLRPGSAG